MNILFITHCHPGRTDFGAAQRSHLLWKALQNIGTVYTVYNVGPHDPNRQIDSRLLVAGVPFLSPILPVRLIQVLVARYFAPIEWPFRSMKYILGQIPWKEVSFDCVVTRYIKNAAQTSAWNIAPLCVDIDDLPSEVFSTVHAKRWPGIVGEFLKIVVAGWQRYILRKCAVSWIANPNQTKSIVDICPCFSLRNLAQGPSSKYLFYGCQKFQLMTVGLMGYEPNYQGVDWFLDNCWTLIRARFPSLIYVIAGGGTPDVLRDKWSTIP